ncbi:hypothetical protein BX264_6291 [Streptomyces sp. 2333.5]|nr:hypothetical protein BX264_6291 [Streptomyces sp. 2333.5]SEE85005.1 hypothetical protein SAMN05428943_6390 [Streptomyces sp. 2314.4]SEF04320.1 hypothetical protein SAMN05428942_6389 [Streptomyces sp. 2112.2]
MNTCVGCGSYLGGAEVCPTCGHAHDGVATGYPPSRPHPLYQSGVPLMPEPPVYEHTGPHGYDGGLEAPLTYEQTQAYEPLESYETGLFPEQGGEPNGPDLADGDFGPGTATGFDAAAAAGPGDGDEAYASHRTSATRRRGKGPRRARRRKGGKTKLALGVAGGVVLVGVVATGLSGELLPTGSTQGRHTESHASRTPVAASVTAQPAPSRTAGEPTRPSRSAKPSASASDAAVSHSAVPASATTAPPVATRPTAKKPPRPKPSPTNAGSNPTPAPRPTRSRTCFLFWCS